MDSSNPSDSSISSNTSTLEDTASTSIDSCNTFEEAPSTTAPVEVKPEEMNYGFVTPAGMQLPEGYFFQAPNLEQSTLEGGEGGGEGGGGGGGGGGEGVEPQRIRLWYAPPPGKEHVVRRLNFDKPYSKPFPKYSRNRGGFQKRNQTPSMKKRDAVYKEDKEKEN